MNTIYCVVRVYHDYDDHKETILHFYTDKEQAEVDCRMLTYSVTKATGVYEALTSLMRVWEAAHSNADTLDSGGLYYNQYEKLAKETGYADLEKEHGLDGHPPYHTTYKVVEVSHAEKNM
jgi:hypothetical protein